MTRTEFIEAAKKQNVIVYNIKDIKEKGNAGIAISFAYAYDDSTVSEEKSKEYWNQEEQHVFDVFLTNQWAQNKPRY